MKLKVVIKNNVSISDDDTLSNNFMKQTVTFKIVFKSYLKEFREEREKERLHRNSQGSHNI